jgi:ATP-dependent helicase IRC3
MFMSLIPKVADQGERTRTLILVSSVDLASQAEGAARRMLGPGYRIEVEQRVGLPMCKLSGIMVSEALSS